MAILTTNITADRTTGSPSVATNVIAGKSQIYYQVQRKDHSPGTLVSGTGSRARFTLTSADTYFNVGDIVYTSTFDTTAEVYAVTTTYVELDITYVAGAGGFLNNLTTNSNYYIAVYLFDFQTGSAVLFDTINVTPDPKGLLHLDVKAAVIPWMERNGYESRRIKVGYQGFSDSESTSGYTQGEILILRATKSLGSSDGAAMRDNLLDSGATGKFLTKFSHTEEVGIGDDPFLWYGWNRHASFAIDSNLTTRLGGDTSIGLIDQQLNLNKVYMFDEDSDGYTIASSIGIIKWSLYGNNDYGYRTIELRGVPSDDILNESLYYKVLPECKNPIMIEWRNSQGALENHLFSWKQDAIIEAGTSMEYTKGITGDIDSLVGTKYRKNGYSYQTMRLMAEGLKRSHVIALAEMKNSDHVRVWLNKGGTSYVDVKIINLFNTPINTEHELLKFSVEIEFPDMFDFFEQKEY